MAAYEQSTMENEISMHHGDLMREASTERMLKAMRTELREAKRQQLAQSAAQPAPSKVRHFWHFVINELEDIARAFTHGPHAGPRMGHPAGH